MLFTLIHLCFLILFIIWIGMLLSIRSPRLTDRLLNGLLKVQLVVLGIGCVAALLAGSLFYLLLFGIVFWSWKIKI